MVCSARSKGCRDWAADCASCAIALRLVLRARKFELLPQVVMVFKEFGNLRGVEAGVPVVGSVHAQHQMITRACRGDIQQADVLLIFEESFSRSL